MLLLVPLACSLAGGWGDTAAVDTVGGADDTGETAGESAVGDPPTILVAELMKDPDVVADDVGEWIELVNAGAAQVDLQGLRVVPADGDGFSIDASLPVDAGDRVVLGVNADLATNGGVPLDYAYSVEAFKMSNEGGTVTLRWGDADLDTVDWTTLPDEKGHAVARDDDGAWCAATTPYGAGDFGTPGEANPTCEAGPPDEDGDGVPDADDCDPDDPDTYAGAEEQADGIDNNCDGWTDERAPEPGDLVIAEIMDNPGGVDDADGEWFEVVNVARVPLVLDGVEVSDHDGEVFTLTEAGVLDADGLYVLAVSGDPEANGGVVADYVWDRDDLHLENDADEIVLSLDGLLLDAVAYDGSFPEDEGKSRSVDPVGTTATRNDDPDYWCEGDGGYGPAGDQGTPGEVNDPCP